MMKKNIVIYCFLLLGPLCSAQTVSTLVEEFPGDGEFSFDAQGNLYINDSGEGGMLNGHRVYKVTPNGDTSLFHSNLPVWVVGSMFDANGDLLVTGWQAGQIAKISADGSTSNVITSGINGAGSLEVDEDDYIYVVEYMTHSVLRMNSDGSNKMTYATGSPIQNPAGLAYVESSKKMYVSNWTNNKICVIDSNQVTTVFAEIPEQNVGPIKIFGSYLFATSPQNHKIYKINLNDSTDVELFAGTGVQGNQDGSITTATFDTPTGIGTLDGSTFYVAETYNGTGRLRIIEGVSLQLNKQNKRKPLQVFPNPANSYIQIKYALSESSDANVSIHTTDGKHVGITNYKVTGDTLRCDIQYLTPGTYYLKIVTESGVVVTEKFIKQ